MAWLEEGTWLTILALAFLSVVCRSFFFISKKTWELPVSLQKGLQYAPIAALSAVIVPGLVVTDGVLVSTWQDARLFGAMAGLLFYFWRKGSSQAVLGTIVIGMLVYLPLHIILGW